jgi:flagellar basal body-associated protein FliL
MGELNVQRADPSVVIAKEANGWLIFLGCLLVVLFAGGVVYSRVVGSETREISPPAKKASVIPKVTKIKSVPSETLLTAVLASGAVLILVGVLYARINSIKLPGGAEIGLSTEEKESAAKKVAEVLPADADAKTAAKVTLATTDKMRHAKTTGAFNVPDAKIGEIVEEVASG